MSEISSADFIRLSKEAESGALKKFGPDPETKGKGTSGSKTRVYPITPLSYAAAVAEDWFRISKHLGAAMEAKFSVFSNDPDDCADKITEAKSLQDLVKAFANGAACSDLGDIQWQFVKQAGFGITSMAYALSPIWGNRRKGDKNGEWLTPSAAVLFWDGVGKIALSLSSQQFEHVTVAEKWRAFVEGAGEGFANVLETAKDVAAGATNFAADAVLGPLVKALWIPLVAIGVIYFKFKP